MKGTLVYATDPDSADGSANAAGFLRVRCSSALGSEWVRM